MNTPPKYTITNESITVFLYGRLYTVQKGAPNYEALRKAIIEENWEAIPNNITVATSIKTWAKGKFTINNEGTQFYYEGTEVPSQLNKRIISVASENGNPDPLLKFWERLQKNPSWRSVQQLFPFLEHEGIPITDDGCFLAYKGVKEDLRDVHSGQFDNSPGKVHEMPRNKISDDPNEACHYGFHVGAEHYATNFGQRTVICKVAPEDVVCIPYDSDQQKMRVCKYEVIGFRGGTMPSTTITREDIPDPYEDEIPPLNEEDIPDPDEDEAYESEEENYEEDYGEAVVHEPTLPASKPKEENIIPLPSRKSVPRAYQKYQKMDAAKLMAQQISDLRAYATHGLAIVGASKIPGGKSALVSKILEVREPGNVE